jgi:hypothetical protein
MAARCSTNSVAEEFLIHFRLIGGAGMGSPMSEREWFSNTLYEEQVHLAERELIAFMKAVTELFGPDQARSSAKDWLDESEMMDSPPRSTSRDWRSVTVAASALLASRIDAARHRHKSFAA